MLKSLVYVRPLASAVPCVPAWVHTSVDVRNRLVGRGRGGISANHSSSNDGPQDKSTGQTIPLPHTLFHVYFDTLRTTQELQKAGTKIALEAFILIS